MKNKNDVLNNPIDSSGTSYVASLDIARTEAAERKKLTLEILTLRQRLRKYEFIKACSHLKREDILGKKHNYFTDDMAKLWLYRDELDQFRCDLDMQKNQLIS